MLSQLLLNPILDVIYPPHCLYCQTPLTQSQLYCKGCAAAFELIDPSERCRYCFSPHAYKKLCENCFEQKNFTLKTAAALDYSPQVASLITQLKNGKLPYLAKTAAAFMALQLERLHWPTPDLIVPIPPHNPFQGRNHAHLIAQKLGKHLQRKSIQMIRYHAPRGAQSKLSRTQRRQLNASHFSVKLKESLEGKIILLVDDVMTTGSTLKGASQALLHTGFAMKVYAITLAKSPYESLS